MNYRELKKGFVIINYDVPSPDTWRKYYVIVYNFPYISKLYDDMVAQDQPALYLTPQQAKLKQKSKRYFYDMFGKDEDYQKIPIPIQNILNSILNTVKSFKEYDILINKLKIKPIEVKTKLIELRQKGIPPKPLKPRKTDFWNELTTQQRIHNELIDTGKEGSSNILAKYPTMKNKKFIPDGRLKRIKWGISENLFSKADKIKNPKYIKFLQAQAINTKLKKPTTLKEMIDISTAFVSARSVLNSRLKKHFESHNESSYIVAQRSAYCPNTIDSNGLPAYDETKPDAKFTWDLNKEIFIGKNHIRLPNDPEADTFEELFISELMPLFMLTRQYMMQPDGSFKAKYLYGYERLIRKDFDDWINLYDVSASSPNKFTKIQNQINTALITKNPDTFIDLIAEIHEKWTNYVSLQTPITRGHLLAWISKREERYLDVINKGYNFADTQNDKSLLEYVEHYNKVIKAYNKKQNLTESIIESKETDPIKNRTQLLELTRAFLKSKGWYYTIPNSDFNPDPICVEDSTLKSRRLQIERELFEIRQQYEVNSELPENIHKEVILKQEFETFKRDGKIETLKNYYRKMINEPYLYSKPMTYRKWLEELIPKDQLPKVQDIEKEFENASQLEIIEKEKTQMEIEAITTKIPDMDIMKKIVSAQDIKAIV